MKQIACAWLNLPVTTRKKHSASIVAFIPTYKKKQLVILRSNPFSVDRNTNHSHGFLIFSIISTHNVIYSPQLRVPHTSGCMLQGVLERIYRVKLVYIEIIKCESGIKSFYIYNDATIPQICDVGCNSAVNVFVQVKCEK